MSAPTLPGDDPRVRRVARWTGPASVAVSAVGIVAATLLAPRFSWTGNALSDLGAAGASTAPLFNGTLVVSGLLGVPFALLVVGARENWLGRLGAALVAAAMPALALVGVFALPSPTHGPVAVAFFVLFTAGILLDGAGGVLAGRREGALSVGLAVAHVLGWVLWGVAGLPGVALPEAVGTVALWVWVLRRFRELRV